MSSDYIELRARSAFSFLEGSALPEDLAERAAELGYPALAMGDRDGLYGAPRFYHGAARAGIRAIVGAELTLDLSGATDASDAASRDERLYVLAPDRERYRNLCRMITASKLRPLAASRDSTSPSSTRHSGIAHDLTPGPFPERTGSKSVLRTTELDEGRAPKYPAKGQSRVTLEDLERYGAGLICLAGGARCWRARTRARCAIGWARSSAAAISISTSDAISTPPRSGSTAGSSRSPKRAGSRWSRPTTSAISAKTARCSTSSPVSGSGLRWRRPDARYGPTPSAGSNRRPRWRRCSATSRARSARRARSPSAASSSCATSATASRAIRCRRARRPTATCACWSRPGRASDGAPRRKPACVASSSTSSA